MTDTTTEVARVLADHFDPNGAERNDPYAQATYREAAEALAEAGLLRAFDLDAECGVCGGTRDRAEIWRRKANRYVNRLSRLTEDRVREAIDDDQHRPGWASAAVRRVLALVQDDTKGEPGA